MTCIVGILDKNTVYIGGDSAGVSGLNVTVRKDPKVFKVGDFLIGITSSFRMGNIIRFSFSPPKKHDATDAFEYMCTDFIKALRLSFKDAGFTEKNKDAEIGGTFLVGYKGRLFKIEADFQVGESTDEYNVCGCGENYALGSLNTTDKKMKPEQRIKKALESAVKFNAGVRPPFIIEQQTN